MPTYAELLQSIEWKTKRVEIVSRDRNVCCECGNKKFIEEFKIGRISIILSNYTNIESRTEITITSSENKQLKAYVPIGVLSFKNIMQQIRYVAYEENSWQGTTIANVHGIFGTNTLPPQTPTDWIYIKGLHVHHKYYQNGRLPWEYPNEALISLCWSCHEELHNNTDVPYLDENGIEIGVMSPCKRCFGAGIFPEYKHIQSGICFRCSGAQYEELINN